MSKTTMPTPPLECEAVQDALIERMLDGVRLANDPALADHVGSCLRCFRMAGDLRGLPQLREQLQQVEEVEIGQADPGLAFWNAFPKQMSAAFAQAQAPVVPAAAARTSVAARARATFAQMRAWLQMPVPAACAGAFGAAIIVVLAMRTPGDGANRANRTGTAPVTETMRAAAVTAAIAEGEASASINAGGLVLGGGIDDSIKDLGVEELRRLRRGLEQTMASESMGRHGGNLADGQAESKSTSMSEELDELDDNGLAVLAENLGGPI